MNSEAETVQLDEQDLRDIEAAIEALDRPSGDESELKMGGPELKMGVVK